MYTDTRENERKLFNIFIAAFPSMPYDVVGDFAYFANIMISQKGIATTLNIRGRYLDFHDKFQTALRERADAYIGVVNGKVDDQMIDDLRIATSRGIPVWLYVKGANEEADIDNVRTALREKSPGLDLVDCYDFDTAEKLKDRNDTAINRFLDIKTKYTPTIGREPNVAYTEGLKLIKNAKRRIIISQKTSCLVLGPRRGNEDERIFYQELIRWLRKDHDEDHSFIHYFSLYDTCLEMNEAVYDYKRAQDVLCEIMFKHKNNRLFVVTATQQMGSSPHVIADTGLGVNFWIGQNRYYLFLPCFITKASELDKMITDIRGIGQEYTHLNIADIYDKREEHIRADIDPTPPGINPLAFGSTKDP